MLFSGGNKAKCGDVWQCPSVVFPERRIFASNLKRMTTMYLKLIRHKRLWGDLQRGTLYAVHFQPNEKGGYNETLTLISDVYEIASAELLPWTFVYPVSIVRMDGRLRLCFGRPFRQSLLHLIDMHVRDAFIDNLRHAIHAREEVRIEIEEK